MYKIFVKICGITKYIDALKVCNSGCSAIGFISYKKSKRFISAESVKKINDRLFEFPDILKVGVFVNPSLYEIIEYVESGINVIQFHGDENKKFISEVRSELNSKYKKEIEFWKAIRPVSIVEIENISNLAVDKILIDSYSKNEYGGTGTRGDWGLAKFAVNNISKPIILAGGITPNNVSEAISEVKPFGLDLSSGVETSPGIKNHKLIDQLFRNLSANFTNYH